MASAVTLRRLRTGLGLACAAGALTLQPPSLAPLATLATWLARPALMPFAWRAHDEARHHGSIDEQFVRAQQVMRLLPTWSEGYLVFAVGFLTARHDPAANANERTDGAWRRLQLALAWLEAARVGAGRREESLLQSLAMLPAVAVAYEPGLAEKLRPHGGAAGMADRYLAQLEARFPAAALREQRTFQLPGVAAALLGNGQRQAALLVLQQAIERSHDVRDRQLAAEWRQRLQEVAAHLAGAPQDLTAVFADRRLEALYPFLR
jgi:hypothetical protein